MRVTKKLLPKALTTAAVIATAALALAACASTPPAAPAGAAPLKVMTFNVRLPTDADGVLDFEQRALAAAGVDFELVPSRYRSTYFRHIFENGYAAGYYSYIWSEVLDADTAAWFRANGGLTRANGQRYREKLLAPGGSVEAMDTYRDFRGQDPDIKHLLERRGLDA